MAPRVRRGVRGRRDRASGQRGRHRPLEHRVRVSRSRARTREPDDPRRHARRSRSAGRRPRGRRGDDRRRAAGADRRAGRRRLRLAGDPASQRRRAGARAARRRRPDRPRRGRLRLSRARTGCSARSRRSSAHIRCSWRRSRSRSPAASAPPVCPTLLLPGARSPGPARLRGQRGRLRDEAGVARLGPPELERPARAAAHRPRLPLGPRRRVRPRRGRRTLRRLVAADAGPPLCRPRDAPGSGGRRDDARASAARGFFHPVGTCAIGRVVDGDGRVYGLDGLVVADASIMPTIPRANTNLSTIALAERIADTLVRS